MVVLALEFVHVFEMVDNFDKLAQLGGHVRLQAKYLSNGDYEGKFFIVKKFAKGSNPAALPLNPFSNLELLLGSRLNFFFVIEPHNAKIEVQKSIDRKSTRVARTTMV